MRHLIEPMDFTVAETQALLALAQRIALNPAAYQEACRHKKLMTLFYEPSTRTRLSFEAAMMNLGGKVLGFSSADSSSAAKGESVADTIRVVSYYADIVAMRHPMEGAPLRASQCSGVPVINAGDGGHQHPTQTLTDLLTILRRTGTLSGLTLGLCGDLKYGRTVHSLVQSMMRWPNNRFVLIAPAELSIPSYLLAELEQADIAVETVSSLAQAMPLLDVLYMTRLQKERFADDDAYNRLKNSFILTPAEMQDAKQALAVLHPLPRVNEISTAVDDDPRAAYFEQAGNGVYVRMALILTLLGLV